MDASHDHRPLLVSAYVVAMRALGTVCLLAAAATAPFFGLALAAPLVVVGLASLLAAQGIGARWIVGASLCIGASLGEIALGGLLLRADPVLWPWTLPLALVALLTSAVLADGSARRWLEPRVARFELVATA